MYVFMLRMAIYFRALLTLLENGLKKLLLPLLDAIGIYAGLFFLKNFWARYHFKDPDYYSDQVLYFNFPLYIMIWLLTVYFSGGYDERYNLRRLARGLLLGTLILAAVYGFLDLEYRSSRALILLGSAWALFITISIRTSLHFFRFGNFKVGKESPKKLIILGSKEESERVQRLLQKAQVNTNFIGTVSAQEQYDADYYLSSSQQLEELVLIYKIKEIIFCSKDVSAQEIMQWMSRLGPSLEYKIVPEESLSIIGSSSKNTSGELYTIDIEFKVAYYLNARNKRILDILLALLLLVSYPLQILLVKQKIGLWLNIFSVLLGRKSWVGYSTDNTTITNLPSIRKGVLTPVDEFPSQKIDGPTKHRLNFFYAKDYSIGRDIDIILAGYRYLGRH